MATIPPDLGTAVGYDLSVAARWLSASLRRLFIMAITENPVSVGVRKDGQGHWVEWMKDGEASEGSLNASALLREVHRL